MKVLKVLLPGNSIIAAGMISYAGVFTPSYRSKMEKDWLEKIIEIGVPHEDGTNMMQFMAEEMKL